MRAADRGRSHPNCSVTYDDEAEGMVPSKSADSERQDSYSLGGRSTTGTAKSASNLRPGARR